MKNKQKNSELEYNVLFDYLYEGLSARQICRKYIELRDPTGFKSHVIYHGKYGLKEKHKGKLFFLSKNRAKAIVKQIISFGNSKFIDSMNLSPPILEKYKSTRIIAKKDENVYSILNGELRNLIQNAFAKHKKERICQIEGCSEKKLEIAHKHKKERKKVFLSIAKHIRIKKGDSYVYPVYDIMKSFLFRHNINTIYFLCHKHHVEYDKVKNKSEFLKKIKK